MFLINKKINCASILTSSKGYNNVNEYFNFLLKENEELKKENKKLQEKLLKYEKRFRYYKNLIDIKNCGLDERSNIC